MVEAKSFLRIGELANRSGVAVSAIHFYESRGLIRSVRTKGRQRLFRPATLHYLAIIKVAQACAMPLEEIRNMMSRYPSEDGLTAEQWQGIAKDWRATLDARISVLEQLRDKLESCISCDDFSLAECCANIRPTSTKTIRNAGIS